MALLILVIKCNTLLSAFLLVLCSRLSWLSVCFAAHIKISLSYYLSLVLDRVHYFQPIPVYRFFCCWPIPICRQWMWQSVTEKWKVTDAAAPDDSGGGIMMCSCHLAHLLTPHQPGRGGLAATPRSPAADSGKVDHAVINQQVGQDHYHHTSVYIVLGRVADKCRWHTACLLLSPADGLLAISSSTSRSLNYPLLSRWQGTSDIFFHAAMTAK